MFSVVCVYNNEKTFNDFLLRSLKKQTVQYELIAIDNSAGRYQSASEALNEGGKRAQGKYVMFVHQDVDLLSNSWLEETEQLLDGVSDLGISGVIGVGEGKSFDEGIWRNTIKWDTDQKECGNPIYELEQVQTLDECLIIIPKYIFREHAFDSVICNDWHLYAVDYCLTIKKRGLSAFVLPMSIWHRSKKTYTKRWYEAILSLGPYGKGYYCTLKAVLKKHKNDYKYINTSCGCWNTSIPIVLQRTVTVITRIARSFGSSVVKQ